MKIYESEPNQIGFVDARLFARDGDGANQLIPIPTADCQPLNIW
jgi:hypothetical protein